MKNKIKLSLFLVLTDVRNFIDDHIQIQLLVDKIDDVRYKLVPDDIFFP